MSTTQSAFNPAIGLVNELREQGDADRAAIKALQAAVEGLKGELAVVKAANAQQKEEMTQFKEESQVTRVFGLGWVRCAP